jgi:hypothetical protein
MEENMKTELAPITAAWLAEAKALFGPPPVLSTEDEKQFTQIFDRVIECLKAADMVELIDIRHYTYATWMIERFTRHATVAIDRGYRQILEFQAQQMKQQKVRKEWQVKDKAEQIGAKRSDIGHLVVLEDSIIESVSDIDELFERKDKELLHNRALEKGILFQEQLDRLIASQTARQHAALRQLEVYRAGLGQKVREATAQIIDAEYKEVDNGSEQTAAPSLVPSQEESANDEPQD